MLQQVNTYEQVYVKDGCLVQISNEQKLIQLKFTMKQSQNQIKIYKTLIYSLNNSNKLSYYFKNFMELKQFLRDSNNINLNKQKLDIQLLIRHPLRNEQIVQNVTLQLVLHDVLKQMGIQDIIKRCHQNPDLLAEQTKKYLYILALQLQMLKQNQVQGLKQKKQNCKCTQTVVKQQLTQINNLKIQQNLNQMRKQKQLIQNLIIVQKSKLQKQIKRISSSLLANQNKMQSSMKQSDMKIKQIQNNVQQIRIQISKINSLSRYPQTKPRSRIKTELNLNNKTFDFRITKKNQHIRHRKQDQSTQFAFNSKLNSANSQIIDRLDSQQLMLKDILNTLAHLQQKQQILSIPPIQYDSFIDPECFHFDKLIISDNVMTTKPDSYAYVFGKATLNQKNRFSVSVRKMKSVMFIGIINRQLRSNSSLSDSPYRIYYQNNRYCWDGISGKNEGTGFKERDKIIVEVDTTNRIIYWKQGINVLARRECPQLQDQSIEWVPYLFLTNGGDSVQALQW